MEPNTPRDISSQPNLKTRKNPNTTKSSIYAFFLRFFSAGVPDAAAAACNCSSSAPLLFRVFFFRGSSFSTAGLSAAFRFFFSLPGVAAAVGRGTADTFTPGVATSGVGADTLAARPLPRPVLGGGAGASSSEASEASSVASAMAVAAVASSSSSASASASSASGATTLGISSMGLPMDALYSRRSATYFSQF
ncbi:hypothetical protein P152DRAFT_67823 [Eremomyces bilateralis CBS 781.70]|uniref:Uncharacterized protein n=1 Tax=Eremomyces bilateralis CBS 781.70 TaxID=1392243 RepID=A0A6G1FZR2_9PEZI|nr:uncharacterized protein P152DRAFT_67823 [Eremomyces bilateralis CBS 781.70]KAF1811283.1 hypothetical protein P152DRAFT_67823 [Eremomyces bilateralis CBS 781.70]